MASSLQPYSSTQLTESPAASCFCKTGSINWGKVRGTKAGLGRSVPIEHTSSPSEYWPSVHAGSTIVCLCVTEMFAYMALRSPMSTTTNKVSLSPLIFSAVAISIILALCLIFNIHEHPWLFDEGGVIESLSAMGYFLCALIAIVIGRWAYVKKYNYLLLLMIIFGLRELDFDKRFTTYGVLKSKLYLSNDAPVIEKIIGLLIIAILAYIVFSIVKNHAKGFIAKVKELSPVYIGSLATFFLLGFTKSIDGIARKLGNHGVILDTDIYTRFEVIEETLELGIPLLMISTLIIYFRLKRQEVSD